MDRLNETLNHHITSAVPYTCDDVLHEWPIELNGASISVLALADTQIKNKKNRKRICINVLPLFQIILRILGFFLRKHFVPVNLLVRKRQQTVPIWWGKSSKCGDPYLRGDL